MLHKIKNRFYIDQIGKAYDQNLSKYFDYNGESHNFIEAVYIVSGCVQATEDGKVYILNEGDIIFHAPMEFHRIKSYNNTAPNIRNLSFTVTGNPPKIFNGVYHLNAEQQALFMKSFDLTSQYHAEDKNNKYLGQYISSLFSSLLIDIHTKLDVQDAFSTEISALKYTEIVTAMQDSLYKNLSLYDLANSNNISVSYLKKLFLIYANTSPKKFYNLLRAKEACHLLEEGLSVNAIVDKMDFSSTNYFSLFFKKQVGCTPLAYKRNST